MSFFNIIRFGAAQPPRPQQPATMLNSETRFQTKPMDDIQFGKKKDALGTCKWEGGVDYDTPSH